MQDYKKYIGRQFAVRTTTGEFHGKLVGVGRSTLEVEAEAYYNDAGESGRVPGGVLIFDRFSILFAQVK